MSFLKNIYRLIFTINDTELLSTLMFDSKSDILNEKSFIEH